MRYLLRKNQNVKIILLFCCFHIAYASPNNVIDLNTQITSKKIFITQKFKSLKIDKKSLPKPYDYLLTQSLMTLGLEQYYQRTAIIKVIHVNNNKKNKIFTRTILMLIDSDKKRNNVQLAQDNKEDVPVELALISINFNELPRKIISKIINTNIPFGKLIEEYNIKTYGSDREYFSIKCDKNLAKLLRCNLNETIYGRKNTLKRVDNQKWIAHTVEILPNLKGD